MAPRPDDDTRTRHELAVAWRDLAVALGDDALARRLNDEVLGPLLGLAEAPRTTSQVLLGWLATAEAITSWEQFEKALDARPRGDVPAGEWGRLRDRCDEALRRLERRNANAGAAKWLMLHLRIDQGVFDETGSVLASCRQALDGLARQADDQAGALPWPRIDQLREAANAVLRRGGDSPPALLRELPAGWLGRLRDQLKRPPKLHTNARLALLALVARMADASRAEWLRQWAARLLAPVGGQAEVISDPEGEGRREFWEKVADPDCDQSTVERPAVVVRKKGQPGAGKCLVKGRWRVSARPAHVAQLRPAARWLRRCQPPEEALASLCEEVEQGWPRAGSDADWWRQAAPEARERMWRMLQHLSLLAASEDGKTPVAGLLKALEDAGFRLGDVPAGTATVDEDWFLLPTAPSPERTRVQRGPALRGPDGSLLGPALWLRVPHAEAARPLVRCLLETQPLRAVSRWRNVAGPAFDEQVWGTAMNGPQADAERCRELFEKCYRLLEGAADAKEISRELTLRLYRCLTEGLHQKPFPPLDPATARPELVTCTPEGTVVDWDAESCEPRGTVLKVRRFGYPGAPGEVLLSAGPDLPDGLREWMRLPPSDAPPLRDWQEQACRLVAQPKTATEAEGLAREALAGWVRQETGAGWFDRLCQAALRGDADARLWLGALTRRKWCAGYPRVAGDRAEWPADAPPVADEVVWDWSDAEPFGRGILVKRFAVEPSSARCLLSLGRRDDRPALARFAELRDELGWLREHVGQAVEECWERLLTAALEKQQQPKGLSPMDLVRPLEALAAEPSSERRRDLDRYLAAVRAWLRALGLRLWPEGEVFTDPAPLERRFDPSPAGSLLAVRFAISPERDGQLIVSAGPGPPCYQDLLDLLRGGDEPAAARLAAKLLAWPSLMADPRDQAARLQHLNRDLFAAFYEEADPGWRGGERARQAEERVLDLVRGASLVVSVPRLHEPCAASWKCYNDRGEEVNPSSLARLERVLMPGLVLPTGEAFLVPKVVVREVGP